MEKFEIYAIKDKVVGKILQPTYCENEQVAKRTFAYNLNSIGIWKDNPEQFELYMLGTINMVTGEITPKVEPTLVAKGVDLIG